MATILGIVASILGAGVVTAVVIYIRRAYANSVALDQRDAALKVEQQRVDAMEAAAVAERAKRAEEFAQKNAQVRTADDAAALLQSEFN